MEETMTWQEYNKYKNLFGLRSIKVLNEYHPRGFFITDFIKEFKRQETIWDTYVVSPTTPFPKKILENPDLPMYLRMRPYHGGHAFTDWRDRSKRFLDALVKKEVLIDTKVKGAYRFTVISEVKLHFLVEQAQKTIF